jgi:RNA polymerase sigma-70 factor, ECF subfamily
MGTELGRGPVDQPEVGEAEGERQRDLRRAEFADVFASESAFRAFYDRALPRVYGYLLHRCGDRSLAEDLTQTVFAEALRHRGEFDGRSDAVTWLTGIARHKLVDHVRAESRSDRRLMQLTVREIAVEPGADPWQAADDRAALESALGRLPAEQRLVLVLHHADGLPVREVAQLIHRSESATESLLSRSMAALRAAWQEAGHD